MFSYRKEPSWTTCLLCGRQPCVRQLIRRNQVPPTECRVYIVVGVSWIIWDKLAVTPSTKPMLLSPVPSKLAMQSSACTLTYTCCALRPELCGESCHRLNWAFRLHCLLRVTVERTCWCCHVFFFFHSLLLLELRLYWARIIYWPWLKSMHGFGHFALETSVDLNSVSNPLSPCGVDAAPGLFLMCWYHSWHEHGAAGPLYRLIIAQDRTNRWSAFVAVSTSRANRADCIALFHRGWLLMFDHLWINVSFFPWLSGVEALGVKSWQFVTFGRDQ